MLTDLRKDALSTLLVPLAQVVENLPLTEWLDHKDLGAGEDLTRELVLGGGDQEALTSQARGQCS